MLISICICTYNRGDILPFCLNSLNAINELGPGQALEIIVVDNNSTDNTREVVEEFSGRLRFPLKYILERQQGSSAARNRGVQEAAGAYVAFLDDECLVDKDWMTIALHDIEKFSPSILGGPYFGAFLPGDRPAWFRTEYGDAPFVEKRYAKGFQPGFRASAGNMFVRREVFEIARFDVAKGPKGEVFNIGEETDLQDRFFLRRPLESVFYDPTMVARHLIRPEKMNLANYAQRLMLTSLSEPGEVSTAAMLSAAAKSSAKAVILSISALFRNREAYPFWQNFAYEQIIPSTCYRAGIVRKYFRQRFGSVR